MRPPLGAGPPVGEYLTCIDCDKAVLVGFDGYLEDGRCEDCNARKGLCPECEEAYGSNPRECQS